MQAVLSSSVEYDLNQCLINVEVDIAPIETARTGFIMVACVMYGYTFFVWLLVLFVSSRLLRRVGTITWYWYI